jgi:pimeloyl-ACP methyl ester carboxylesterase
MNDFRARLLSVTEPIRSVVDVASLYLDRDLFEPEPIGNKEPIMVLPGYRTSDVYTQSLRTFLTKCNYTVYGWSQGKNMARMSQYDNVKGKLKEIQDIHDQPVRVIGYSLGGLYARKLASEVPEYIDSVITVGTPISQDIPTDSLTLLTIVGMMTGADSSMVEFLADLDLDPVVPTTVIYSREDGIVDWRDAVNGVRSENVKHIRVNGAHMGMVHNATVWRAIRQVYQFSQ